METNLKSLATSIGVRPNTPGDDQQMLEALDSSTQDGKSGYDTLSEEIDDQQLQRHLLLEKKGIAEVEGLSLPPAQDDSE